MRKEAKEGCKERRGERGECKVEKRGDNTQEETPESIILTGVI